MKGKKKSPHTFLAKRRARPSVSPAKLGPSTMKRKLGRWGVWEEEGKQHRLLTVGCQLFVLILNTGTESLKSGKVMNESKKKKIFHSK